MTVNAMIGTKTNNRFWGKPRQLVSTAAILASCAFVAEAL